jgi:hypothetical protein
MLRSESINVARKRCQYGMAQENYKTRCYGNLGHGGPHKAKKWARNPYEDVRWMPGTPGEFVTDKDRKWAWINKEKSNG